MGRLGAHGPPYLPRGARHTSPFPCRTTDSPRVKFTYCERGHLLTVEETPTGGACLPEANPARSREREPSRSQTREPRGGTCVRRKAPAAPPGDRVRRTKPCIAIRSQAGKKRKRHLADTRRRPLTQSFLQPASAGGARARRRRATSTAAQAGGLRCRHRRS